VIELPVLDDRTYADFAGDARARIPSLSPDWTDHNPSDPGIAVVELLAWLAEMVLYRIDRVPAKSYRTFLALLRGPSAPSLDAAPLDIAIRDTIADLRALHRAITPDDFEHLALHRWPAQPAAQTLGALGTVRRALAIPEHSPATLAKRWKPNPELAPGHVTVIVVPDALAAGRADLPSFDPGRKFALELDGTAAYVDCGSDASLKLIGALTLSAWIFPRNLARGRQGIISKSASGEYELVLEPNGALTFAQANGHDGGSSPANVVTAGRWNHVAAVRASGGGSVTLLVDGRAVQTLLLNVAPDQIPTTISPVLIGRLAAGGGFFDGFVRDVAIWGQQRTATDLDGDLQRVPLGVDDVPPGDPTPRPVACWRLDARLASTAPVPDCETPAAAIGGARKRDGSQHGSGFVDVVHPMPAAAALLDGLRAFYNELRLLTTRVDVIGSSLLYVAVTANLYLSADADVPGIRAAASAALIRFLDPQTGLSGEGWPLGRAIYSFDLQRVLDAVPGVDFVTGVQVAMTDPAQIAAVAAGNRPPPPQDENAIPIGVSLQPDELPGFDGATFTLFQRLGGTRWQQQP
jgi:hypothetical protein